MKKLAFILIPLVLLANVDLNRAKLIFEIAKILFPNANPTIYVQSETYKNISNFSDFKMVENCEEAKIILIDNSNDMKNCLKNNPALIATDYKTYTKNPNVIAAIFWQKGRQNLIFRKEKLDNLNLSLPKEYSRYIE